MEYCDAYLEPGLMVMIALAVVVLVQAVGLVLVMALLTLPAATALLGASSVGRVMLLAIGIAAFDIVGGLALAYRDRLARRCRHRARRAAGVS